MRADKGRPHRSGEAARFQRAADAAAGAGRFAFVCPICGGRGRRCLTDGSSRKGERLRAECLDCGVRLGWT